MTDYAAISFDLTPGLPRTKAHAFIEMFEQAGQEIGRIRTLGYRRPSTVLAERISLLETDIRDNGDASRTGGGEKARRLTHYRKQLRQLKRDGK